ncbi:MAG: hypothetical protein AB1631_05070 [Acidobacteriota bacterium]
MFVSHHRSFKATFILAAALLLSPIPAWNIFSQNTDSQQSQVELQATGDLDMNFGAAGKVTDTRLDALAIAAQGDGKFVVGGSSATVGPARYKADGSLDTSFGNSGYASRARFDVFAIAIQPDGRIVTAGSVGAGASADFALARYNADGSLDASFGASGQVSTDFFGFEDVATAVLIQPDGRIVAGGRARTGDVAGGFGLARYNPDGSLDASFGSAGRVTTNFSAGEIATIRALAIQPDQRIVAAGSHLLVENANMLAARYTVDGNLDASFGSGGKASVDFSDSDFVGAMAIQPDNRIVLAGGSLVGTNNFNFALARLNEDGALDQTFGAGGKVTTDFCGDSEAIRAIAFQSDGRLLAAGQCRTATTGDFAIARYNSNGALDATFGAGGKVTTDFSNTFDLAVGATIQTGGRLLVAGQITFDNMTEATGIAGYVLGADYGIGFSQSLVSGERGSTVKVSVAIIRTGGFTGNVTITPPDASSLKIKVKPGLKTTGGSSASFKLKIKGSASRGSHQLTFIGRDETGRQRSATLTLVVQ